MDIVLNMFGWMMFRAGSGHPEEFKRMWRSLRRLPEALHQDAFLQGAGYLAFLAIPLLVSEWLAYRRKTEFPDVLYQLSTGRLAVVFVTMWFGAIIFAKRSGYDFIYFAF